VSGVPGLGPPPCRIDVDADQVRRLVADHFPQWAALPVASVADGGWDNRTFHLGSRMSVRLPSAAEYALAVDQEHAWLPVLAPQLPLTADGRRAFRERMNIGDAEWARGRGWALWKTLAACASTLGDTDDEAWRALGEIFSEFASAE
jgi:hypothetical protein